MPRPKSPNPPVDLHTTLPTDLAKRIDELLWSDVQEKVPRGAVQTFLVRVLRDYFSQRQLDLAPYLNSLPGVYVIQGSDQTLLRLINHLKGDSHGKSETSSDSKNEASHPGATA